MRLSDIRQEVFYGLLLTVLIALATFFYHRYFYSPLDTYYSVMEARWPDYLSIDRSDRFHSKGLEMMRLHIKNVTEKSITVSTIRVYGVKSLKGIYMVTEAVGFAETPLKPVVAFDQGQVTVNSPHDISPNGETHLYVWASFFPRTWVEMESDAGTMIPKRLFFVKGVEEYFARHWVLNLLLALLILCFIGLYFAKKKNAK